MTEDILFYLAARRADGLFLSGCSPRELERIVQRCLEKSPADRYEDGDELVVRPSVDRVGGASVRFVYEIVCGDVRIATGMTELACIDLSTPERGVRMLPERLRGLMRD